MALTRKNCADCGQSNLDTENACWACGSSSFAPADAPVPGDPTRPIGEAGERTLPWLCERPFGIFHPAPTFLWLCWLVGGCLALLATAGLGFWVGRASSAPPPASPAVRPVEAAPSLPPPPASASPGAAPFWTGPQPPVPEPIAAAPAPAPPVTVRPARKSRTGVPRNPAAPLPVSPGIGGPVRLPPIGTLPRPQAPRPASTPSVVAERVSPPPDLSPQAPVFIPEPTSSTAVVTFRNGLSAPVEITLVGEKTQTAVLAARATLPLQLPSGTYEMRASCVQAAAASSTLALGSNRSYELVIRRAGGDKPSLEIGEPSLED